MARARALAPLRHRPYRTYLGGHAVASTGVWMQNIATDWLVLELTGSPAAVGITMACQFAPVLLLGLHAGMLADRFPKRTLLLITQACFLLLTATLAALTLTGAARVELVWVLALLGGCVTAVDGPARQAFAGELVPAEHLRGAVSLNSAVFQTSRLLGPAVAATLISTVGTGWAFAATAACFTAPLVALSLLRPADLLSPAGAAGGAAGTGRERGGVRAALRHVRERPHVAMTIVLVGVVGTFGLNFPVVLTAMASEELGGGPQLYGAFNTALALGSTAGALLAGTRATTRLRLIVVACAAFGLLQAAAALAPTAAVFLVVLVAVGLVNLAFQAMAKSSVQLWVAPALRGRVMGLYLLAFVGGTPVGAPLVGAITETWGPRVGMAVCGLIPAVAAVVVAAVVVRRERAGRAPAPASTASTSTSTVPAVPAAQVPAVSGDLATGGAAAASLPSRAWQPGTDAPASSSSVVTPPAWPAPRRRSSRPRPAGATSRWSRSSAAARPRTRPAGSRTGSGAS